MSVQETLVRRHFFPLPLPAGPWRWEQLWADLLFMHWPVPAHALRPHVPARLDLDTWDGSPWVSLVAFRLKRVRRRWLPSLGLVANILELNLRTYVRYRGEPAIYFLSIHADSRLAIALARLLTPLPYRLARMGYHRDGADCRFQCSRLHGPLLDVCFTPHAAACHPRPGSPAEWLLERYGLYAAGSQGNPVRTVVEHAPWQVQDVAVHLTANTMGEPWGLRLSHDPELSHYSPGLQAHVWPFANPEGATMPRAGSG